MNDLSWWGIYVGKTLDADVVHGTRPITSDIQDYLKCMIVAYPAVLHGNWVLISSALSALTHPEIPFAGPISNFVLSKLTARRHEGNRSHIYRSSHQRSW